MVGADAEQVIHGPFGRLHHNVILSSRDGYPLPLMLGATLYGNLIMKRESGGKRYPTWILGWPVGLIVYTYPASVFSDVVFQMISPHIFADDKVFLMYTFWFLVIQFCEPVYHFFLRRHVFVLVTTLWLADAMRLSLVTMERSVEYLPTFSRGMWQAFFWCSIVPVIRCVEFTMRGLPVPNLSTMVPNTFNAFRHPLISTFFLMVFYLAYLGFLTGCDIFGGHEKSLTMVKCGDKHKDIYATVIYAACTLHIVRSFYYLHIDGKVFFGEIFRKLATVSQPHTAVSTRDERSIRDLEQPLIGKNK